MSLPRLLIGLLLVACGIAALAAPMPGNTLYLDPAGRGVSAHLVLQTHRERMKAQHQALVRYREMLIRKRIISPRMVLPRFDTFIVSGAQHRAVSPTRLATTGTPVLTFAYSGWTAQEEQELRSFLTEAYPVLVNIYGDPLASATVTVVKSGTEDLVEGGEVDVTDPANPVLRVNPLPDDFTTGDYSQYGVNLLHLVLHTFHASALIGYDAWEEGMARAAASVAMLNIRPNYEIVYSFTYLLPLYESLNQPALANSTFFPAQGIPYMSMWRVGMSMSAWLKVYAENSAVFRNFNLAYAAAGGSMAGNLGALKSQMAAVVPSVEGQPFLEWYARQYALQPTAVVGNRLYVFPMPLQDYISLQIYYFRTNADGTEVPLNGTANLEYNSYDQLPLYPEEGDQVAITNTGDYAGIGFISPSFYNIGDPPTQRIRIGISIGPLRAVTYYPYYTRGDDANESEFFGAIVGSDAGKVRISTSSTLLGEATVTQGAFNLQLSTGDISFFSPIIFAFVAQSGKTYTVQRNVGPGFYVPVMVVGDETAVSLVHTFLPGLSLVSFPLAPDAADVGPLFGYTAGSPDFSLAKWDPALPGADKYRRYPGLSAITPGQGYWVKMPTSRTVTVPGKMLSYDDPRTITLAPGWNMIGNTYNARLDPWAMTVLSDGIMYTLMDAISRGIVGPVWCYADGKYVLKSSLAPWEGAWIFNAKASPVVLGQYGATRAATRSAGVDTASLLFQDGWGLALEASSGSSRDTTAYLGVSGRAREGVDGLDWIKPPAAGNDVRVAFVNPGQRQAGANYATDVREHVSAGGTQWEFAVTTGKADQIALRWPDLRAVPRQYRLVLEDLTTGTRQYLRTTGGYSYLSTGTADQPDTRRFRLTVEDTKVKPLTFVNVQVVPTRGSGTALHITTSADADVMMEIRSPIGKLIRTIRVPAMRANQPMLISWDGRATGGKLVPTGAYTISLTARTAEGYVMRRNQPVMIRQ